MPYLVDGNNLCGAARDSRLRIPTDESEMVRLVAGFASLRRARVTIVFDGLPGRGRAAASPEAHAGSVRILFSGKRRPADDLIVDLAQSTGQPRDLTVVTSDRALRARVVQAGCRVMGCRDFASTLNRRPPGSGEDKPLAPGDVEDWERWFAGED